MVASLARVLSLAALLPLAACDLYFRSDGDEPFTPDARDDLDGGTVTDAGPTVDAPDDGPPPPPPNPGFVNPVGTTRANLFRNGAWTDVGPADWSCLNQTAEPLPARYTISGTVRDFASGNGAAATIGATALGQPLGAASTTNQPGARGQYRMELAPLPAGATRVRFKVDATGARSTITIDRYLGPSGMVALDLPLMSDNTARSLPAFVGMMSNPNAGLVVGDLRDCQGRMVSGAIVALSQQTNLIVHWPGGVTFYFSAGSTSLPVRHDLAAATNRDGRFMVLGAQAAMGAEGSVQAWGFPTEADRASGTLRLLGRNAAVIDPSTVSSVQLGRQRITIAQ